MRSGYHHPLNLGTDRLITINDLAKLIMRIANYECSIEHVSGPQGVRGRNSDNTRIREVLSWEPKITLEDGLTHTYYWIEQQWLQTNGVTLR
jgi:nucleoside-diphosphate-sugar epimerase